MPSIIIIVPNRRDNLKALSSNTEAPHAEIYLRAKMYVDTIQTPCPSRRSHTQALTLPKLPNQKVHSLTCPALPTSYSIHLATPFRPVTSTLPGFIT